MPSLPRTNAPKTYFLSRLYSVSVSYGPPTHCRPHHPQTQGKDEGFNQTLHKEAIRNCAIRDLQDAQARFDEFRNCYNNERPHEALNLDTPANHYKRSSREYQETIAPWEYSSDCKVRMIKQTGYLTYEGQGYFLSEALSGLTVGIRLSKSDENCVNVLYRNFYVARVNIKEKAVVSHRILRVKN
jgi:hypothetical protein